jgi:folate-binding protein YgfZ
MDVAAAPRPVIPSISDRDAAVREYQAIKAGAGFSRLDDRRVIRVVGDDRVAFMHGMCTADVKGMSPGQVVPALFVTERAHVIRDFYLWALADALLIEIDRIAWPGMRANLEKFLVADDVEFEELDTMITIDCMGPASADALAAAGLRSSTLPSWRFESPDLLANLPQLGYPGFTLLVDDASADDLLTRLAAAGLIPLGPEAREIVRVEQGVALVGVDTSEKTLALEALFERAIAPDKGCYIGQETIERATARGGIKRRLCGLRIEGRSIPPIGAVISYNGKTIGTLTSIVDSPAFGLIGLAILQHSAWTSDTAVNLCAPSGSSGLPVVARVFELPFR